MIFKRLTAAYTGEVPFNSGSDMQNNPMARMPAETIPAMVLLDERERAGAVSDVFNLFASFGASEAAATYQEILSDTAAQSAAARWPLVTEWIAATQGGAKAAR